MKRGLEWQDMIGLVGLGPDKIRANITRILNIFKCKDLAEFKLNTVRLEELRASHVYSQAGDALPSQYLKESDP